MTKTRALVGLLATALMPLSLLSLPPHADAATPATTAFVLFDPTRPYPSFDSNAGNGSVTVTSTGGVTTYQEKLSIEPAPGQRFGLGRISLTPGGTDDEPRVRLGSFCATTWAQFLDGYLDVREVTYAADGSLVSFAADASLDCGYNVQTAQVRLASTLEYASVQPNSDYVRAYPGDSAAVHATFTNNGNEPLTPGTPYLTDPADSSKPAAPSASITAEDCSSGVVDPGDTCTVTVTSPPSGATVQLPVPELDGLVARAGMLPAAMRNAWVSSATRPGAVVSARAVPAVDGIQVRWVPPAGTNGSYRIERLAPDGSVTLLRAEASGLSFADTDAPADQASSYRITPVGEAGPDAAGSKTTAATTPHAWTAPEAAQTYVSVDGSVPAPAGDVQGTPDGITSSRTTDRPSLTLTMRGGWQLGRHDFGDADGQAGGSWSDDRQSSFGIVSGTLTVTRLAARADGTPVELAASLRGTRWSREGGTKPVSALIVLSSVPSGLPGYLTVQPRSPQAAAPQTTVTASSLHTKVTPGTLVDLPVTLTNVGGAGVTPTGSSTTSILISPERGSSWSAASTCIGATLAPGAACTSAVRYDDTRQAYPYGRTTWTQTDGQSAHLDLFADGQDRTNLPTVAMQLSSTLVQRDVIATVSGAVAGGEPVQLWCRLDLEPLAACPSPWNVTGLAEGVHTLRAFAATADGRMSDWASRTVRVDRTGPVTVLNQPAPGLGVVMTATARVAWDASDAGSGVVGAQARSRTAGPTTSMGAAVVPGCCTAIPGRSVDVAAKAGAEQCWSVRSVDAAGLYGAWTDERCFVAPVDDRRLAVRKFTRTTSSAAYARTRSVARLKGATMTLTKVRARQIGLVVATCRTCGSAQVLLGGRSIGTVRTASSRPAGRVVLWLPRLTSERAGTLVVRTTGTRPVTVDGVLVHHF